MVEFTDMLFTYIYLYVGMALSFGFDTVDGRNPANQLRLAVYPIINTVFYIPGRAGFLPSTLGVVTPVTQLQGDFIPDPITERQRLILRWPDCDLLLGGLGLKMMMTQSISE